MDGILPIVGTLAGIALVIGGLARIASRARARAVGGSVLGAVDEIFHPAAYEPRMQVQIQAERRVPMPSAGDVPGPSDPRD